MNTIDKYKQLVERYFEATTTEEQEDKLRAFLTTPPKLMTLISMKSKLF